MKKSFCILVLMLMALSGTYTASAQNKAIQVNSSSIELSKPLILSNSNPEIRSKSMTFTFGMPLYGIQVVNVKKSVSLGVSQELSVGSDGNEISSLDYGYIVPQKASFMNLGTATLPFRYLYCNSSVTKSNPSTLSDGRYKENIKDLQEAVNKVLALRAVSFDLKADENTSDTTTLKNKVGFIAQEMQNVLPHSVGYIPEVDMYTVDYVSVIPYLVSAFQHEHAEKEELKNQMEALQEQLESMQELVQSLLTQNGTTPPAPNSAPKHGSKNNVKAARLFQNLPNPFSESTIIRYELPKAAGNAYIQVFDMGGRMVQNLQLSHTQETGQVELTAGELLPGAYTYSLIVSGKVIDSKRMVVTE